MKIIIYFSPKKRIGFFHEEAECIYFNIWSGGKVVLLDKNIAPIEDGYYQISNPRLICLDRCFILTGKIESPDIIVIGSRRKYDKVTFPVIKEIQRSGFFCTESVTVKDCKILTKSDNKNSVETSCGEVDVESDMGPDLKKLFKDFKEGGLVSFYKNFYTTKDSTVELVNSYLKNDNIEDSKVIVKWVTYKVVGPVYYIYYREFEPGVYSFEVSLTDKAKDNIYDYCDGHLVKEEVLSFTMENENTLERTVHINRTESSFRTIGNIYEKPMTYYVTVSTYSGYWNDKKYIFEINSRYGWEIK